jgi:hypothetical protein
MIFKSNGTLYEFEPTYVGKLLLKQASKHLYPLMGNFSTIQRRENGVAMMPNGTGQAEVIREFAKVAADYCAFLEDHCAYSTKQFTAQCSVYLAVIDQAIPDLPQSHDTNMTKVDLGPISWIARNITDKLGDQDRYEIAGESGAFSDNLTNIYSYLKPGVLIYNTDPASAVAHWKSRFAIDCQPDLQRARAGLS